MRYVLDGKFLSQKVTGVQRYQREIIKELDKIIHSDDDIVLLVPPETKKLGLEKIKEIEYGLFKGNLWEQISFNRYRKKNKMECVCLGNTAPFFHPGIVEVYDMNVRENPAWFSLIYRIWNNINFFFIFRKAKVVITESQFSKKEILKYYKYDKLIPVIYSAWQHFSSIEFDDTVLSRLGIKDEKYYFAMSSWAPNKNFKWIYEVAKNNPDHLFLIAGMTKKSIYGRTQNYDLKNVKMIGYVSDSEAKSLMAHARAFLFPTFYEGFGLPPLEALSVGTPIIVSDLPVMREIYQDVANYINPNVGNICLEDFTKYDKDKACFVLNQYSWTESAKKLYQLLVKLKDEK